MDSIERMRRLNELTKELKQRGFADSSFEAINQANQIYGDDELTDNVKHGIIEKSAHERIIKEDKMADDNVLIDKKIAKISENVDILTNKLNEIIKAINDLDERVNALKNRPERVVERVVEKPVERVVEKFIEKDTQGQSSEKTEAKTEKDSVKAEESKPAKKDEYSMDQRTGTFQSQDVAIDKMFYFGKK